MLLEEQMELIEKRVDSFFSLLAIRRYPRNLAQWAVLTKAAVEVQKVAAVEYGSVRHRNATVNFSRVAGLLLGEISNQGNQRFARPQSLKWSPDLDLVTYEALRETDGYFHAVANFPYWREKHCRAEVLGQRVRFTSDESARGRQIKALEKRISRKQDRMLPEESLAPMTPRLEKLFESVVSSIGGTKSLRITYSRPNHIYAELLPWFQARSETLVRYRDELDLGRYTMKQVKAFVAALQTMCAVHDHLCYLVTQKRLAFPTNSAVLTKRRSEWIFELSDMSGVARDAMQEIVDDLIFGVRNPIDLHSELFVQFDQNSDLIGLLPQFGLSAGVDENLLRTLARKDSKRYDRLSDIKEQEMTKELGSLSSKRISVSGPFALPKEARTDLDLVVVDENSSTVLIAELKWIRKPMFAKARTRADEEFLKGIAQLAKVKAFLDRTPSYLKVRGAISRDLSEYAKVHFALIGRDHMVWPESDPWCLIVEYEVFKERLAEATDLNATARIFSQYEWLPVEGVDFELRMESATVSGITIEGQTYHTL